jgi:hypothetical protein
MISIWWKRCRARTAQQFEEAEKVWDFDLAYYWSIRLSYLAVILLYGPMVPLLFPVGLLYFSMNYAVDRLHLHGGMFPLSLPAVSTMKAEGLLSHQLDELREQNEEEASTQLTRVPRTAMRIIVYYCAVLLFIMGCIGIVAPSQTLTSVGYICYVSMLIMFIVSFVGPWHKHVYYPFFAIWGQRLLSCFVCTARALGCCGKCTYCRRWSEHSRDRRHRPSAVSAGDGSDSEEEDAFDLQVSGVGMDGDEDSAAKARKLKVLQSQDDIDLIQHFMPIVNGFYNTFVSPSLYDALQYTLGSSSNDWGSMNDL